MTQVEDQASQAEERSQEDTKLRASGPCSDPQ